jgi:peroxiredoxin
LALAILAPLSLSGCLSFFTGEVDKAAPDFQLTDIDGNNHTLAQYQGRVLLVDMMGTWCAPCQRAVPFLRQMLDAYPNLSILSVSSTDQASDLRQFQRDYNITWPMAVDTDDVVGRYVELTTGDRRVLWPAYALIGTDGRISFFNDGETLPSTFAAAIAQAAKGPGPQWTTRDSLTTATAFILGGLAWFSPFLMRDTALHLEEERKAMLPWALAALLAIFALTYWLAGSATKLLSGRVYLTAPFVVVGTLIALAWWRLRERQIGEEGEVMEKARHEQVPGSFLKRFRNREYKPKSLPRRAVALPGHVIYHAFPAWFAVFYAGMLSINPRLGPNLQLAFGGGVLVSWLATWLAPPVKSWVAQRGPRVGWLGATGWLIGATWIAWLRFG